MAGGAVPRPNTSMQKLVECVPNVSEGRNIDVIDALAAAVRATPDVALLDVDAGAGANRTVYTFVGAPAAVGEAAFRLAERAAALIDMRTQAGSHPRLGALDVCPFVPLAGSGMDECVALAHAVGRRIGRELDVPVYFYERAALVPQRRLLADVRAGEYEGLRDRLADPAWAPDEGPAAWRPAFGACIVGARPFLVALNVTLGSADVTTARRIAARVRERSPRGRRLPGVRAIGWYIPEYERAQVSMNLVDIEATAPHVAVEAVRAEAAALGAVVEGSELVGLMPLDALLAAGRFYADRNGSPSAGRATLIREAVHGLGLERHRPFDANRRVVELALPTH